MSEKFDRDNHAFWRSLMWCCVVALVCEVLRIVTGADGEGFDALCYWALIRLCRVEAERAPRE